jgi:hypothetical protein
LSDVVDTALDHERICAVDAVVETRHDLIGPLTVDAAVAKLEPGIGPRGPVLPLAPYLPASVRVVAWRALADRIAEGRDDDAPTRLGGDQSAPRSAPAPP